MSGGPQHHLHTLLMKPKSPHCFFFFLVDPWWTETQLEHMQPQCRSWETLSDGVTCFHDTYRVFASFKHLPFCQASLQLAKAQVTEGKRKQITFSLKLCFTSKANKIQVMALQLGRPYSEIQKRFTDLRLRPSGQVPVSWLYVHVQQESRPKLGTKRKQTEQPSQTVSQYRSPFWLSQVKNWEKIQIK